MPYIKQKDRKDFDEILNHVMPNFENKGELEYVVYKLMLQYMSIREYRYTELHSCVYAVIHAAEEFKRNFLDKREDQAKNENGEII